MKNKVYITAYSKISALDEEPDFKAFISPIEARRMGKMMKRAVVTSKSVLQKVGVDSPDSIITGTGLGCLNDTEAFLKALEGVVENAPKPTNFIHSTHNTISSMIAILTSSNGYNATYSHLGISFESALLDALMQIQEGSVGNSLVNAFEEMTPDFCKIYQKAGYQGLEVNGRLSETAVSMFLSTSPEGAMCELEDVIIKGKSGDEEKIISEYATKDTLLLRRCDYAEKYGNNFSVSALGACDAAEMLASGEQKRIVLCNDFYGKEVSAIILSRICGN